MKFNHNWKRRSLIEALESRRLLDTTIFLSDLQPAINPTNGWGPIEKDRSNGEIGANDGKTITLNGNTYPKGLGVHAGSEIAYDIQATSGYTSFLADVGIDDEVGNNGSVVFQVWLGNQKVYDTNAIITGASNIVPVNVNISGYTGRVRLVVTDAGNGNTFDHADWANARFLVSTSAPSISLTRTSGGDIAENGGSAGFSFNRLGSTAGPLTINFSAGGTATRGSDYQLRLGDSNGAVITGNTVTFPNGASSVLITATTIDDQILDPNENIMLAVSSGSGYTIGGPNTASPNIIDNDQAAGFSYLTDLPFNSAQNGWGPFEINRSNGEAGANDGKTITLNGSTYTKGLGVHANSFVEYLLNGSYNRFEAVIGVDDEVGNNGSVTFQVFANNVKVYESGVITGAQGGLPISVPINGATILRLVVTDGGNGNAFDHADWGDAKLLTGSSGATDYALNVGDRSNLFMTEGGQDRFIIRLDSLRGNTGPISFDYETFDGTAKANEDYIPVSGHASYPAGTLSDSLSVYVTSLVDNRVESGEQFGLRIKNIVGSADVGSSSGMIGIASSIVPLSNMTPSSQSNGWGPFEKNKSNGEAGANDGHTISLNGKNNYSFGLGVHANSELVYNISQTNAKTFSSEIGVDDEVGNNGSVVFQVWVDGQKKYDSDVMTGSSATKAFSVDVTGASTLRLVVTDAGDGNAFDHADWAGAFLG